MKMLALLSLLLGLHAQVQEPVRVIPLKPDPPIAVDGNLDEWATVPGAIEVRGKEHATHNDSTWRGPEDLGATVRLAWRNEGLFLAADITDDLVLQMQRDEKLYQGDHVEWFIDVTPDSEPTRSSFGKGQFQFAFSPGNFKTTGDPLVDIKPEMYCYKPKGMAMTGVKYTALRTPTGWLMEAMVPFSLLGITPAANLPLGCEVAISDSDSTEPAQETYMTIGTKPWVYNRLRVPLMVLGDVAGKGTPPASSIAIKPEFTIEPAKAEEVAFATPEVPEGKVAHLFLKARIPSAKPAGYTRGLRLTLNGVALTPERVTNRPVKATMRRGSVQTYLTPDGIMFVPYAPDFVSYDKDPNYGLQDNIKIHEWEFKVGDLLKPEGNALTLQSMTDAGSTRSVVVADLQLRLKAPPPPPVPKRPAPTGPLAVIEPQAQPECKYGKVSFERDTKISLPVQGETFVIESRFSMPDGTWLTQTGSNAFCDYSRKTDLENGFLRVTDQFVNKTKEPLPIIQRHSIDLAGRVKKVWCAGVSPSSGNITMMEPANPTTYGVTDKAGIGLMAMSDELQVHVMNSALEGVLGLADNTCVLKPGATYQAEFVIVPTERPDFWDFVNSCRRIRGANFTLTQMFAFLSAKPDVEKWSDEKLTEFIRNKSANIVCASIDYPRYEGHYAHGTAFQRIDHSNYARHNDRVRRLCPEVKTQVYFHCFLNVEKGADEKYADARTLLSNGQQANYGEDYYKIFFPTLTNQYGKDTAVNIDQILGECKADGVYWDEVSYSAYKYHYGEPWDGISGDIDPQTGKLLRLKSSVTLLSQPWIVAQMQRIMAKGPLMTNGAPHTRTMGALHYQTFVETAAITNCLRAVLYSPVALGDHISERKIIDAYRWMTDALNYGCLYSWYGSIVWPEYETLTKYMFPTTPIELHEGYIIGKERIVTNRSGLYGWGDKSGHEAHVFNDEGREVKDFKAPVQTIDGKTYTELRLAEGWTAAIVRK